MVNGDNPYVGPRSFRLHEALFFGRDREVRELTNLLTAERVVVLHAPAGAGKTSLIQAGLIPALEDRFRVPPMIRVSRRVEGAASANPYTLSTLLSLEGNRESSDGAPDVTDLTNLSLANYLVRHRPAGNDQPSDLLIFDQFEEVLTLEPDDVTAKERFFAELAEVLRRVRRPKDATEAEARWALFVLREEYLSALEPYLRMLPVAGVTYRLDLLSPKAAKDAIGLPADKKGVTFSAEALGRLVDNLRQVRQHRAGGSKIMAPGSTVEPVLLQVVCYRLWERLQAEGKITVGLDDIDRLADVDNALSGFYADKVSLAASRTGVDEATIRTWFDERLISPDDRRVLLQEDAQLSVGLDRRAVKELVDSFLVRRDERRNLSWLELAHDRLIEPVRRENRRWKDERQSTLPGSNLARLRQRQRPIQPGLSVSTIEAKRSWTLGCLVRNDSGQVLVLGPLSAAQTTAEPGAIVIQPGRTDGGQPEDAIAEVSSWIPVDIKRHNHLCGSLAKLLPGVDCNPAILGYGPIRGLGDARVGQAVVLVGRTSSLSRGRVEAVLAFAMVNAPWKGGSRIITFTNQILVRGDSGGFSDEGDSGAPVLSEDGLVVGMLLATSEQGSIVQPLRPLLNHFKVELLTGDKQMRYSSRLTDAATSTGKPRSTESATSTGATPMSAAPGPELFLANGLNAVTGAYLLEPQTPAEVVQAALGEQFDPDHLREMQYKVSLANTPSYAPAGGLDAANLAEVGWGVVLHANADPKVLDPLRPLLDHRKKEAGQYYRELIGPDGYWPGDTHLSFLTRLKAGPGPADPERVPYYLLLVGGPDEIPFEFQYQLDIQYGVGRIHFDTADEYAAYAAGVLVAEASALRPRRAGFFATTNPDDRATQLSAELLVAPLQKWTAEKFPNWGTEAVVGEGATRSGLASLLGGSHTPALLFTASHGLALPQGHARQLNEQGSLVCQEWPGPLDWRKEIPAQMAFGANDVTGDVRGLVAFVFACFGAGTPLLDDYPHPKLSARPTLAKRPFLARLPQRLLASGALAVVGHIERGWPSSFSWQNNSQLAVFQGMIRLLLKGQRVGWALDQFNVRYSELAAALTEIQWKVKYGFQPEPLDLSFLWMALNDARGFVVLGDPAVRLSAVAM